MKIISDYEKQKKVDFLAWQWFPRSLGFWTWFIVTIYFWKSQKSELDYAAIVALASGIGAWVITKLITLIIGTQIIHINLWEYGCGCLVRIIAIELFHYFAIATICVLAIFSEDLSIRNAIIVFIIGSLNWAIISIKNL